MNSQETYYFNRLKKEVFEVFSKTHSCPSSFERFGKEDITAFQEHLFDRVKTRVSEKWFYTYFKNAPEKLPRIDMLNLLCQYISYQNWSDFKDRKVGTKKKKVLWLIPILVVFLLSFFFIPKEKKFNLCFIDKLKNENISEFLYVKVLRDNETPLSFRVAPYECLKYKTKDDKITIVISSPYYKTDTITRSFENSNNLIPLTLNNYTLILDYYIEYNQEKIGRRYIELKKLIDDEVLIYQHYPNQVGVEIYSKEEFISFLTIPTKALKNIKILDVQFKDSKIVKLNFIVK